MEPEYILISLKHTNFENKLSVEFVMWKDNYAGYTSDFNKAGRYTLSQMKEYWKGLPSWLEFPKGNVSWDDINKSKFDTLAIPVNQFKKFGFVTKTVLMKE